MESEKNGKYRMTLHFLLEPMGEWRYCKEDEECWIQDGFDRA